MKTTAAVIVLVVFLFLNPQGRAQQPDNLIEYSWSGQILPLYVQNDPWGLGQTGQPFQLSFTLDSNEQGHGCDSLFASVFLPFCRQIYLFAETKIKIVSAISANHFARNKPRRVMTTRAC
jgi:hypothetical protein